MDQVLSQVTFYLGWIIFFLLVAFVVIQAAFGIRKMKDKNLFTGIISIIIGAISLGLAWVVLNYWLNSVYHVLNCIGWIIFSILVIVCPIIILYGICSIKDAKYTANKDAAKNKAVKKNKIIGIIYIITGLISAGMSWVILNYWLNAFYSSRLLIGWIMFAIFGVLCVILIGWGIYNLRNYQKTTGVIQIIFGLLSAGISWVIIKFWLNSIAVITNIIGLVLFWSFGILGALLVIWGVALYILRFKDSSVDNGLFFLVGGTVGISSALAMGSFVLHIPWLPILSFWNPYLVLPVSTIITGIVLGFGVNLCRNAIYSWGNTIDRSHEWRYVGNNAKHSDASIRDVYDHINGRGSWAKNVNLSVVCLRFGCILASSFGLIGLLLYTNVLETYDVFKTTVDEFNALSLPIQIGLSALLLFISGLIELAFASMKKPF